MVWVHKDHLQASVWNQLNITILIMVGTLFHNIIARSALTFESAKLDRPKSVRSSFFGPLRQVIAFWGGDMEVSSLLVEGGVLTHRFFGSKKLTPLLTH